MPTSVMLLYVTTLVCKCELRVAGAQGSGDATAATVLPVCQGQAEEEAWLCHLPR